MIYFIELSKSGIEIFKGGNIEVMKEALIYFDEATLKDAQKRFDLHINETVGSAMAYHFTLRGVGQ